MITETEAIIKSCNLEQEDVTHKASQMDGEIPKMERDSKWGDSGEGNQFYQAEEVTSTFHRLRVSGFEVPSTKPCLPEGNVGTVLGKENAVSHTPR